MNKIKNHGQLVVISGPSGCGKDTVVKEVLKRNKNAWLSISCTSRPARPGEVHGKEDGHGKQVRGKRHEEYY